MRSTVAERARILRDVLDDDALSELRGYAARDKWEETDDKTGLNLICMEDVQQEAVKWLWRPYIPLGKITILQGDPGLGKTFIAARLAAIVSKGDQFPYSEEVEKNVAGNVIFQSCEDGLGDTIKARLTDASADCKHIFVIDESAQGLTLDDDRLRTAIEKMRPRLVVIDPLQGYIGADTDFHRANEIRPIMSRLGSIAAEYMCAVVLIGHQNKVSGGKSVYRGLGSIDITAAARSVLAVGEAPNEKYRRAVVQIKSSLAPNGKTILFDLDPARGFLWAGMSDLTADDVLNYHPATERKAPERDECAAYLKDLLSDGPLSANEVWEAMSANGYKEATVNRAKKTIGVVTIKEPGKGGQWTWQLFRPDKQRLSHKKRDNLDSLDNLTNKGCQDDQDYQGKMTDSLTGFVVLPDNTPIPWDAGRS